MAAVTMIRASWHFRTSEGSETTARVKKIQECKNASLRNYKQGMPRHTYKYKYTHIHIHKMLCLVFIKRRPHHAHYSVICFPHLVMYHWRHFLNIYMYVIWLSTRCHDNSVRKSSLFNKRRLDYICKRVNLNSCFTPYKKNYF